MYLQASRDKFKPKAFSRMINKIRHEEIDVMSRDKYLFINVLAKYS